jgi:integrase
MAALANLSKYLGCYDYWRGIVRNHGLRWEKRGGVEAFLSIVNTDLREVEGWLRTAVRKLPRKYKATLAFLALTGVRPSEACNAVRLIVELNRRGELDSILTGSCRCLSISGFRGCFLRRARIATYPLFLRMC